MFRDFAQIFWDFSRIFDKSKLLGVRLHPLHPRLLYHCNNILFHYFFTAPELPSLAD